MRQGETTRFRVRRMFNEMLNMMYPEDRPLCLVCKRPMDSIEPTLEGAQLPPGVCIFCLQTNLGPLFTPVIGKLRLRSNLILPVVCVAQYDGWLRDAIRHWKYDGTVDLTNWFAERLAQTLSQVVPKGRRCWDCIVPVPTARDRMRKRGYDHVGLLATALAGFISVPVVPLLERKSALSGPENAQLTRSQTTRSAKERLAAIQDEFVLSPTAAKYQEKRVLLVDDVVTTGATMQACGNMLSKLNLKDMHGAALAHVQ